MPLVLATRWVAVPVSWRVSAGRDTSAERWEGSLEDLTRAFFPHGQDWSNRCQARVRRADGTGEWYCTLPSHSDRFLHLGGQTGLRVIALWWEGGPVLDYDTDAHRWTGQLNREPFPRIPGEPACGSSIDAEGRICTLVNHCLRHPHVASVIGAPVAVWWDESLGTMDNPAPFLRRR